MPYTSINFKTKKQLKEAVKSGQKVAVYQYNDFFGNNARLANWTGYETIEGPHYPEPHRWYARVKMVDGIVVEVK